MTAPTPPELEAATLAECIRTTRCARARGLTAEQQVIDLEKQGYEFRHIDAAIRAVYFAEEVA